MSQQNEIADGLRTGRDGITEMDWRVETDTGRDGREAVRISWEPDADLPALELESGKLSFGWEIVQFGVNTRDDGESNQRRYVTLAEPKGGEPALYDSLARELTASELRDYLAVERFGYSQTGWAEASDLNRSNVSERVNSARRKLDR